MIKIADVRLLTVQLGIVVQCRPYSNKDTITYASCEAWVPRVKKGMKSTAVITNVS